MHLAFYPLLMLYFFIMWRGLDLTLACAKLSCFPFLFCSFFFLACILAVPQNKDSLSVYLQQAQFCLHLFPWLHSHICPQPAEYPAVCLVLLLLPAERSGLDLDWCQAVCAGWSAPHVQLVPRPCFIIEYIYDERTSEMTFYKSSHSGTAV